MLSRSPQIEALAKSVRRKSWKLQAWIMQKMHWNRGRIYILQVVHLNWSQSMEYMYIYIILSIYICYKYLLSKMKKPTLPGTITYPTEREVWKIIDSKVPTGRVHLSSQEGNISVLHKKLTGLKQQPAGWWLNQPIWKNMKNLEVPHMSCWCFRNIR